MSARDRVCRRRRTGNGPSSCSTRRPPCRPRRGRRSCTPSAAQTRPFGARWSRSSSGATMTRSSSRRRSRTWRRWSRSLRVIRCSARCSAPGSSWNSWARAAWARCTARCGPTAVTRAWRRSRSCGATSRRARSSPGSSRSAARWPRSITRISLACSTGARRPVVSRSSSWSSWMACPSRATATSSASGCASDCGCSSWCAAR